MQQFIIPMLGSVLDHLDPLVGAGESGRRQLTSRPRSPWLSFSGVWIALIPMFPPVRPPVNGNYPQQMQYWRWQQQQQIQQQIQQFNRRQQQNVQQLQEFQQQQRQITDQQRQQLECLQECKEGS